MTDVNTMTMMRKARQKPWVPAQRAVKDEGLDTPVAAG